MKLWINFDEKDIKKRKEGWIEGDDYKRQVIYEKEQEKSNCYFEFNNKMVTLHFDNGFIEIPKSELGGLF